MKTLVSLTATPLLFQPQHTDGRSAGRFAAYCHRISPVSIDTANTSLAPVLTYATPAYTIGCAKPEYCGAVPEPRRRARQTPLSCATLERLMRVSGEYRWLYRLPPLVGQPPVGGAVSAAPNGSCAAACACWARPAVTSCAA